MVSVLCYQGTLEAAAAKLGEQMKIGRVDATAHPGEATDFGRLGKELPSLVLFRAAVKLEHYTGARDAEAIVAYMVKIAATDENVDEDWGTPHVQPYRHPYSTYRRHVLSAICATIPTIYVYLHVRLAVPCVLHR